MTATPRVTKDCPGARIGRGANARQVDGYPPHTANKREFGKNKAHPDGLARVCGTCWSAYTKALRQEATAAAETPGAETPGDAKAVL